MQQAIAQIQCVQWDSVYQFDVTDFDEVKEGESVVVDTQLGLTIGTVLAVSKGPKRPSNAQMEKIVRLANKDDLFQFAQNASVHKKDALDFCKKAIRERELSMKILDVHFSLDGQRITFAFVANGRVDFRQLVKDLAQHFRRAIRLQQIGVRDETAFSSDIGACGQKTCCSRFLKDLGNVNSGFAELQSVSHRGADRLSGVCGRLACCLRYEQDMYEQFSKGFPSIGDEVTLKSGKKGIIKSVYVLKGLIAVAIDNNYQDLQEVTLKEIKKRSR